MNHLFTYDAFSHAFAGTVGGAAAMSLFFPLDTLRTYAQAGNQRSLGGWELAKQLYAEDGAEVFVRGLQPALGALACSNFVYFYAYNALKAAFSRNGNKIDVYTNLKIGYVAGLVNVFLTCPCWVAATRLRTERRVRGAAAAAATTSTTAEKPQSFEQRSLVQMMLHIADTEGWAQLWSGATTSAWLVANPTIQWAVYEQLKKKILRLRKRKTIGVLEAFFMAMVAKVVATVITYPLQVCQTRLRAFKKDQQKGSGTMLGMLARIVKEDGLSALFAGLNVKLLQTSLTSSFHFAAYEKIVSFVLLFLHRPSLLPLPAKIEGSR